MPPVSFSTFFLVSQFFFVFFQQLPPLRRAFADILDVHAQEQEQI
jgi:hypothetical protein